MAARYWIGGAGNWNDPLHWSATSGGVGGASVPTMDDDVYFDNNSGTGTVTVNAIANMRDCTFTQTQLITLANAAYAFNIFGSWTLCSNTYLNTSFTGTGYVYLKATASVNITSNGCTRAWNRLHFDGVGGTWTNQDDMNVGNTNIYHHGGTWTTYDKTITFSLYRRDVNNLSVWNLGSSIINCSLFLSATSNYTVNAGTSTINCASYFRGGTDQMYYNVNLIGGVDILSNGNLSGLGNFRIYNLSVVRTIEAGQNLFLTSNITVINSLTLTGLNSNKNRLLVQTETIGTPRTITCNGSITASNVDFRDIVGAGTANWDLSAITGGSGDCGGNSGITFTPSQTQYHRRPSAGGSNWSTSGLWFTESGNTGRVPLPQDDVVFDENSFPVGTSSVYVNVPRIGRSLNMEAVNQPITMTLANNIECYGSFILGTNITLSGSYQIQLIGNDIHVFKSYNKTANSFNFFRGDYTFQSNATQTSGANNGQTSNGKATIRLNGYTWYIGSYINNMLTTKIYFGTGTLELNGSIANGLHNIGVIYAEQGAIKMNCTGSNNIAFNGDGKTFNKVWFSGSHTGNFDITGSNAFAELIIDEGRKVRFTNGTTQTINKLTAIGTPDKPITIGSTTAGQRHTINYTGSEASAVEYCSISDSKVTQARRLLAKISVDAGNNQNWGFEGLPLMALNFGQVEKMYVGGSEVVNAYYGAIKIK